jgi:hypothetical protein
MKNKSQSWPAQVLYNLARTSISGSGFSQYIVGVLCVVPTKVATLVLKTTVRPWERKKYTLQWEPITGCRPGSASGQSQST